MKRQRKDCACEDEKNDLDSLYKKTLKQAVISKERYLNLNNVTAVNPNIGSSTLAVAWQWNLQSLIQCYERCELVSFILNAASAGTPSTPTPLWPFTNFVNTLDLTFVEIGGFVNYAPPQNGSLNFPNPTFVVPFTDYSSWNTGSLLGFTNSSAGQISASVFGLQLRTLTVVLGHNGNQVVYENETGIFPTANIILRFY
jgi:hypothetical protein